MTAIIEHAETASGTWTRRPATLTGTQRTYHLRSSTARSLRALARESPEEGETRWRANTNAMKEARARESQEEGEIRRRANADAMREGRARRIADRGWQTLPVHRMPHSHPLRLGGTHECPHCHAVLLKEEEPSFCCREGKIQLAPFPPLPRGWLEMYQRVALAFRKYCCSRPNVHAKVAEASEATCMIQSIESRAISGSKYTIQWFYTTFTQSL